MNAIWQSYINGLLVAAGLIMAIGAQNAFVLRQGVRREHVGAVVLVCMASDAVLILAGVGGFARAADWAPWLETATRYAGAAFLLAYGLRSFLAAARSGNSSHLSAKFSVGSLGFGMRYLPFW